MNQALVIVAATVLLLPPAGSGDGAWNPLTAPGSPAFAHHDMTYDPDGNRLIVCGRSGSDGVISTHFYTAAGTWTAGPSAASSFPAQYGNDVEVTYDRHRGVAVLYTSDGTASETWELGPADWEPKSPSTTPVACPDGGLFQYDADEQQCLLVGCAGWPSSTLPSETWLWDGADWSQAASGEPVGGAGGGMAFDEARGEMVLLTMISMNTWVFRDGTWTQKSPATVPTPGIWVFDMAYDVAGERVIAYGGEGGSWPDMVYPTTTWSWNGADWTALATAGTPPSNIDHAMFFFPPESGVVMHGGWCNPDWRPRDATWLFSANGAPGRVTGLRIGRNGADILLTWNESPGAPGYRVQSGEALGTPFTEDLGGSFDGTSWRKPIDGRTSEFYEVFPQD